ncbi:hypothetical protein [Rhodopirellula bahusiensis]|uniref:hypothetical protein n=1 Tax=Rhodopirellula bahusiensis TaxID=2014065 RepID=UPI001179E6DE|nr:hypothetical protein [Rhodopirellula bahusiensis]
MSWNGSKQTPTFLDSKRRASFFRFEPQDELDQTVSQLGSRYPNLGKRKNGRPQMLTSASMREQFLLANSVLAEVTTDDF